MSRRSALSRRDIFKAFAAGGIPLPAIAIDEPPIFRDVAAQTGLNFHHFNGVTGHHYMPEIMGAGVALFDYDNDGDLDIYLVQGTRLDRDGKPLFPPPPGWKPGNRLFRNMLKETGKLQFTDVTEQTGLNYVGYGMGVAVGDYNNDGYPDLYVTNFGSNILYRNKGDGTFADVAVTAGIAFNEAGVARAGMGTDAADYDGSGRQSLIIGNFSNEMMALYSNEGNGLFIDEAPTSTIGKASLLRLTFSCFFFDFDLDGLPDIFAANGHVADDINTVQPTITYAQPPHLFRNLGNKKFEDVSTRVGAAFAKAAVARGAAYGDFDNDGDLDLAVMANNGPARLFRNEGTTNHKLRLTLVGSSSNRDAIGAKVRVTRVSGVPVLEMVKTGSSYLSQSERPLTIGLGAATKVGAIDVTWPTGKVERLPGAAGDQSITIVEGKGVVKSVPLGTKSKP